MSTITNVEVRMYKMGTGDCFAIKFFTHEKVVFKLMIDAGTWSGSSERLNEYILDLKSYLGNEVDVLLVTHEHKDHVHAFAACENLFTDEMDGKRFEAGEIWMAWTENDNETTGKVSEWKEKYGEKKKALGLASLKLSEIMESAAFKAQFTDSKDSDKALAARGTFRDVLNGFADLHLSFDDDLKVYKGGLKGMEVVKNKIKKREMKYYKPGDIIENPGDTHGMRIYILGPPVLDEFIKKEAGGKGESYDHNKTLRESEAFGAAVLNLGNNSTAADDLLPFDEHYMEDITLALRANKNDVERKDENDMEKMKSSYHSKDWRKIDFDWLYSSGSFALRMNGLTNNLSLAIAIEIKDKDNKDDNGKVILFPGDAEFGSWASWHQIPWNEPEEPKGENGAKKNFTENLLNRTVFYKVAHHLSHNGTAQRLGLEMMTHKDLVAMATLDYENINSGWTSTMPNRSIIKELLNRTKGRLMLMNENKIFYDFHEKIPLTDKIIEARSRMSAKEKDIFDKSVVETKHYIQYKLNLQN